MRKPVGEECKLASSHFSDSRIEGRRRGVLASTAGGEPMNDRASLLKRASIIALAGNSILAAGKIATGLAAGSLAVLSDGVDSATDIVIAIMSLFASKISSIPGDKEHPYGHARAETIATTVLSFIVFYAGFQLFITAAGSLLGGKAAELPGKAAIFVTIISIAGKLALAWSQFYFARKTGSTMLKANGINMRGDVVTSCAVLVGLGLTYLLGIPVIDRILALLVSLWILKNAIGIFLEANAELMEGTSEHEVYDLVFKAVASVPQAGNPHRARIRRLGTYLIADLDIEVDPAMTVAEAHDVALRVEASIKTSIPDVYDVIVHIEPVGNNEDERFGLTPESKGD